MLKQRLFHVIVGLFFIVSAILKMLHPSSMTPVLSFLHVSDKFIPLVVGLLVCVEMLLGLWLIMLRSRLVVQLTAGMLVFFTMILGILLVTHDGPSCGCLGVVRLFKSNEHEIVFGIGRNLLLIGLLVIHSHSAVPYEQPCTLIEQVE